MASEQYKIGTVSVTNGSQVVIGASTDWLTAISLPAVFKADIDGEPTYSVGSVVSGSRILLSANYTGSTHSGIDYMICRSFTTNRGYWRPLQGDADFAEILSQETIDKIDEDISSIITGNATVDGTTGTSFGIDTDGNTLRIKSTNLTASRYYHFPNKNASIPAKSDVALASDIVRANASIDTLQSDMVRANASIDALQNINVALKTNDYQIATVDEVVLASGNINIILASASNKFLSRIANRSLDTSASIRVKASGSNTIENNASIILQNKYDSLTVIGDGENTHLIF